jgi:hypothetical protein
MKVIALLLISLFAVPAILRAQSPQYPPLRDYLMPRDSETALAKTAAPDNISSRATIKVLTAAGFQSVHDGDNGFVCVVMRAWSAPTYTPAQFRNLVYDATVRAPICFDADASKSVLPYYELRTSLGMAGKTPDQIAAAVKAAYDTAKLPKRKAVSFAYMFSPQQVLGPGIGHWHPHMMVFAPFFENAMLGGSAFGTVAPQVSDDAGTPFTVIVIPVDRGWGQ